jgi:hypothetical protein
VIVTEMRYLSERRQMETSGFDVTSESRGI